MRVGYFILLSAFILGFALPSSAQSASDLAKYGRVSYLGSARYTAMGGAFSALGNDFAAVGINPAGLAVYRMDEASIGFYYRNSGSSLQPGLSETHRDGGFRFSQLALVSVKKLPEDRRLNWGLTYNRGNEYGFEHDFNAANQMENIVQQWSAEANYYAPLGPDQLYDQGLSYQEMAYYAGLISYDSVAQAWSPNATANNYNLKQFFRSRGSKSDIALNLAWQQTKTLSFGASLNIPVIYYSYFEKFEESNYDPGTFSGLVWENEYDLSGVGFQIKLGALWTPSQWLRLGAFYHSPMWMSMSQTAESTLRGELTGGGFTEDAIEFDPYTWNLSTGSTYGLGFASVVGKYGLISVDYIRTNLPGSSAKSIYEGELDYLNEDVDNQLKVVQDIRVGVELRFENIFVRGGMQLSTSPVRVQNTNSMAFSGGVGYKANKWSVDAAYKLRNHSDQFEIYSNIGGTIERQIQDHIFMLSLNYRL